MAPTRLHDRRVFLEGAVASCGGTHLPLKYDGPNFGLGFGFLKAVMPHGIQIGIISGARRLIPKP